MKMLAHPILNSSLCSADPIFIESQHCFAVSITKASIDHLWNQVLLHKVLVNRFAERKRVSIIFIQIAPDCRVVRDTYGYGIGKSVSLACALEANADVLDFSNG